MLNYEKETAFGIGLLVSSVAIAQCNPFFVFEEGMKWEIPTMMERVRR